MIPSNETPPLGAAGLGDNSFPDRNSSELNTKPHVAQAKIELVRSDIVETIGPMIATLEAALAMAAIPNDAGLKYSLRCARAYWRSISGSAGGTGLPTRMTAPKPIFAKDDDVVDLLTDAHGVYGMECQGPVLALRPDRLGEQREEAFSCALQFIPAAQWRIFKYSAEGYFARSLHNRMLARHGYDKALKFDNEARKKWHGLRRCAIRVTNGLLAQVMAVADQDALKLARRFCFHDRYAIYAAAATHRRFLQAIEAFPALGVVIFTSSAPDNAKSAKSMILRGEPLREVAKIVNVPWVLKRLKPGAARFSFKHAQLYPQLFEAYLPDSMLKQKTWMEAFYRADEVSPDFVNWTAKNAINLGRSKEIFPALSDIADWARASEISAVPDHFLKLLHTSRPSGSEAITRKFTREMSLDTVRTLSHEWHEAVAANLPSNNMKFPEPWFPKSKIGDWDLVPLKRARARDRQGRQQTRASGATIMIFLIRPPTVPTRSRNQADKVLSGCQRSHSQASSTIAGPQCAADAHGKEFNLN